MVSYIDTITIFYLWGFSIMKSDTKKIIITIINIVIFIGNAIISALGNGGVDANGVAMVSSAGLSMLALV